MSSLLAGTMLPANKALIILPVIATILVFTAFVSILKSRVGLNLFGEVGFIYLTLAVAYTIFPAITFLLADLDMASGWLWDTLSLLLPSPAALGAHLWRHVLFIAGVSIGYLLVRGKSGPPKRTEAVKERSDSALIVMLASIILCCMFWVYYLSAPVVVYWDHYTRFEHLGWFSMRFIYICLTLKTGGYFILLALSFPYWKTHRLLILAVVAGLVVYETSYTMGQRIESLTILLAAICLYHYHVKPVTLKMGMVAFLGILALFTAVEIFRLVGFNFSMAQSSVAQEGLRPASEFGAVYFTSFHLYAERAQGSLPPRNWQLLFNDFLSLIPFIDHTQWNPQYWYARYYFPDAIVPPQTLGPIAESAIWGGEIDLAIRSLINGAIFAWLVRWFLKRKDHWWAMAIYAYLYATCVMTLKYSVFYQLTPLVRILVPSLLVAYLIRKAIRFNRRKTEPSSG
ncbi:MAG: hypothetical protein P4L36_05620 [Holophaga sp.]|nr:hypothetical protein [Holophaga sp.]